MTEAVLVERQRELASVRLCGPGGGATAERHRAIIAAGREDLSLAKLIEAHWDAVAILEEAGRTPMPNALYAVWASEIPRKPLLLRDGALDGTKEFCSGSLFVDRALITAGSTLVEVDVSAHRSTLSLDETGWRTDAFRLTRTAAVTFSETPVLTIIGNEDWYTQRIGFWQGACGPAAAWAGGAAGLLDYALTQKRNDAHTLAHIGAMYANVSSMRAILESTGDAFDRSPQSNAMLDALAVRHTIEQLCTDTLRRFMRAFGPAPLVKNEAILRRYAELDLFLRQSHAERDLELLGSAVRLPSSHELLWKDAQT